MANILSVVDDAAEAERPPFFSRQFAAERTTPQVNFDVVFGVVGPIACFIADPVIFKSGMIGLGEPFLGRYQLFAYLTSAIAIAMLIAWLSLYEQVASISAFVSGILFAGSVFSTVVGILILPLTLIGSMFLIGIVGFTPFFTAFVYVRNGVRAFRCENTQGVIRQMRYLAVIATVLITIAIPVAVDSQISSALSRAVDDLVTGDANQAKAAADKLSWFPWLPSASLDQIVAAYGRESDPKRKEILKTFYVRVTGEDIDQRLMILND